MLKYLKTRQVIQPSIAHPNSDAGIDFFIPEFNIQFLQRLSQCNNDLTVYVTTQKYKQINELLDYKQHIFKSIQIYVNNVDLNQIRLQPHQRILIPSGIHVDVPLGYALIAFNKSGVCTKTGLIVGACVVDHGYQGQVHISLINTNNTRLKIQENMKAVQFVLIPIGDNELQKCNSLQQLYNTTSKRGTGGFGSSN